MPSVRSIPAFAAVAALALLLALAPAARALTTLPDAVGDAAANDIVSVSGSYDDTALRLEILFAPGTADPANLYFELDLDVDLDATTGSALTAPGADVAVFYNSGVDAAVVTVARIAPAVAILGTVAPTFAGDRASVSVPLALIADDGVVRFGAQSGFPDPADPGSGFFVRSDVAPQGGAGRYVLGGPTTRAAAPAVPEPTASALFAAALAVAGAGLRRRRDARA